MTDAAIRRAALVAVIAACAVCWSLAYRFHSIAWAIIAAWLTVAFVAEIALSKEDD
jgi:hypothetical protein